MFWLFQSDVPRLLSSIWISVLFSPKAHLYHAAQLQSELFGIFCLLEFSMPSSSPNIVTLLSSLCHFYVPFTGFLLSADVWDNRDNLGSSTPLLLLLLACSQQPPKLTQTGMLSVCPTWQIHLVASPITVPQKWFAFGSGAQSWKRHWMSLICQPPRSQVWAFLLPSCLICMLPLLPYLSTCITPDWEASTGKLLYVYIKLFLNSIGTLISGFHWNMFEIHFKYSITQRSTNPWRSNC